MTAMTASANLPHPTPQAWLRGATSHLRYAQLGATNASILGAQVQQHAGQAAVDALRSVLCAHHLDFLAGEAAHDLSARLRLAPVSIPEELTLLGEAAFEPLPTGELMPRCDEKHMRDALRAAEAAVDWAQQVVAQADNRDCR